MIFLNVILGGEGGTRTRKPIKGADFRGRCLSQFGAPLQKKQRKPLCEPTVSQVEPLFDSVITTYYKLEELGIQEVDGKIEFIDNLEVNHE